ncbi:MAG: VanZ family protein [Ignavibacterium sp.]|nr:VanZ family protein [Ignavibacterium sp.]
MSIDKLVHFGVFSMLTYFLFFTFSYQEKIWFIKKHRTGLTVIVASLIGIGVEVYQLYNPTRSFNVNDMIANLSGALFTVVLIKYLPKRIKKLRKYSV